VLDVHEVVECGALLFVELGGDGGGVHGLLTLSGRKLAQGAEAAGDGAALVLWELVELLEGAVDLLTLVGGEAVEGFGVDDVALALVGLHAVEIDKTMLNALLLVLG